jgi:hypothetical protein
LFLYGGESAVVLNAAGVGDGFLRGEGFKESLVVVGGEGTIGHR